MRSKGKTTKEEGLGAIRLDTISTRWILRLMLKIFKKSKILSTLFSGSW